MYKKTEIIYELFRHIYFRSQVGILKLHWKYATNIKNLVCLELFMQLFNYSSVTIIWFWRYCGGSITKILVPCIIFSCKYTCITISHITIHWTYVEFIFAFLYMHYDREKKVNIGSLKNSGIKIKRERERSITVNAS